MKITEFIVGETYKFTKLGTNGDVIIRKILAPANKTNSMVDDGGKLSIPSNEEVQCWTDFLRVQNPDNGKVHLLHLSSILTAHTILE